MDQRTRQDRSSCRSLGGPKGGGAEGGREWDMEREREREREMEMERERERERGKEINNGTTVCGRSF